MTGKNAVDMNDDEFMNSLNSDDTSSEPEGDAAVTEDTKADDTSDADVLAEDAVTDAQEDDVAEGTDENADTSAEDVKSEEEVKPDAKDPEDLLKELEQGKKPVAAAAEDKDKDKADPKSEPKAEAPAVEVDHKAFFEEVMKPFNANGKQFQIKSPAEVRRLMEMGAGFGKKMAEIQPHIKVLKTLEKHNLLDESRISYLIDIDKKNPDAIKKLVKESGVDPLDLYNEEDTKYTPTNHVVSNNEVVFGEILGELKTSPQGLDTIRHVNSTWDVESKNALGQQPQLMKAIHEQRVSGVYQGIVDEMDRQTAIGQIPASLPFLERYRMAGDSLMRQAGQMNQTQTAPVTPASPQVLGIRTAPVAPKAGNDAKVRAAAAPRTTPRTAKPVVDLTKLSDDEFLNSIKERL